MSRLQPVRGASLVVSIATAALAATTARTAHAGDFDARGVFHFSPGATTTVGFEGSQATGGATFVQAADALEGATFARLAAATAGGGSGSGLTLQIAVPAVDQAYRARGFVRKNRVTADVNVTYADTSAAPSLSVRFFPTGRVTSDGWYEVTTGHFSVAGHLTPTVTLRVSGAGAEIDAFELVVDGTFSAAKRCAGPSDPVCGAADYCGADWCRSGEAAVPPLPPEAERADVSRFLGERIEMFFGGHYTRTERMPIALGTIAGMTNAKSAWEYWNGFATAIHQLHDWHTITGGPSARLAGRGAFPICVVEGDADLSHDLAPKDSEYADAIVSIVGPKQNSGLKAGDRIVAINGMHPFAFVESLESVNWNYWRADDPHTHAEAAELLVPAVRRWAREITVIRCDPQTHACTAPETIKAAELPVEDADISYPVCDHRPGYHLQTGNPDRFSPTGDLAYGLLADSQANEALYGMIWDSVEKAADDSNPFTVPYDDFRANAKGVILDHRTGNGGTSDVASYLTSLFRAPADVAASSGFNGTFGLFDASFTSADGISIWNARQGYEDYTVGATDARVDLPVALLLARDGSASDWFPLGMKDAGKNVRIFGRRTAGAFSSFLQFDYYGQFNWQLASGDLVLPDGTTHLGHGVEPDEELLPKQSDLLVGRDTVYERALEWIRCTSCR